jgi:hypothetical protein
VALTTLSTLLLELSLTRIFSVAFHYHFAFLAISIALFGLGAGGGSVDTTIIEMERFP